MQSIPFLRQHTLVHHLVAAHTRGPRARGRDGGAGEVAATSCQAAGRAVCSQGWSGSNRTQSGQAGRRECSGACNGGCRCRAGQVSEEQEGRSGWEGAGRQVPLGAAGRGGGDARGGQRPAHQPLLHPLRSSRRKTTLRGARQKGALLVDLSRDIEGVPPPLLPPGVLDGRFRVGAGEVAALRAQLGCSEDELLAQLITPASQLARPPISSFHVG